MNIQSLLFGALLAFIGVLAMVLFALGARTRWRRYRQITDTVTSSIGRLRSGVFEVQGKVRPSAERLVSPLSQTPCVYYRFVVQERRQRRKKSVLLTLVDDTQTVPCVLDDGTGTVVVPLDGADLHLRRDHAARSGVLNDPPEALRTTLAKRYELETQGLVFNKSMTYAETVVAPGDTLFVLGTVEADGAGWRFDLRSAGAAHEKLLVSDHPERSLANRMLAAAIGFGVVGVVLGCAAIAAGVAIALQLITR